MYFLPLTSLQPISDLSKHTFVACGHNKTIQTEPAVKCSINFRNRLDSNKNLWKIFRSQLKMFRLNQKFFTWVIFNKENKYPVPSDRFSIYNLGKGYWMGTMPNRMKILALLTLFEYCLFLTMGHKVIQNLYLFTWILLTLTQITRKIKLLLFNINDILFYCEHLAALKEKSNIGPTYQKIWLK